MNVRGCYNAIRAAVEAGHTRFVNTGPMASLVGHHAAYHHQINEEMPPMPGLWLYSITKALGHEVTRVFSVHYPIHVMRCLVSGFFDPEPPVRFASRLQHILLPELLVVPCWSCRAATRACRSGRCR